MPLKKSELYSSLWQSCDELRGGMDASQYKDYVLVLLFVKYVSDKYAGQRDAEIQVPKSASFADMVALKSHKDIGEGMMKIINRLAEANDLQGIINVADFDDDAKLGKGQEKVDRLTGLIGIFEGLNFSRNRADGDDLLGDAYEYLMRHFATESGKSKGQFYTPAEVSRIMAQVIGVGNAKRGDQTIHDPTCGSGSLLLKAHDEAKSRTGLDLALYGQEMDNATAALARMNMYLHDCNTAEIERGNTLSAPHWTVGNRLKTFDFVVANPPFSSKNWRYGFKPEEDLYGRFPYGVPPKKNGDYSFLLHVLACLNSTGKGAIIMPHGVLFRGNTEADIRREIVRRGYIKGIIGLPPNLFYGTGIPACIVVLDKEHAASRTGIFMIDASLGFIKDGAKNRLRAQDIHKIVDVFNNQREITGYSRLVPREEIQDKNDNNLGLPRYIDASPPDDLQDIEGHLRGGIPDPDIEALQRYWDVFPSLRATVFESAGRSGYSRLRIPSGKLEATVLDDTEVATFNQSVRATFDKWKKRHASRLSALTTRDSPKAVIAELSEDLLNSFKDALLIDPYDVYQRLMDYWGQTMQDDVYLVVGEGWAQAAKPRLLVEKKDQKNKEEPDFALGKQKFKSDLLPRDLMIGSGCKAQQTAVNGATAALREIENQLDELRDEHGVEGGLLEEVIEGEGEKRKITAKAVKDRLLEIGDDSDFADERSALEECASMLGRQAEAKAQLKAVQRSLETGLAEAYGAVNESRVKSLTVDSKWHTSLAAAIDDELDRISRGLTTRLRQLAERYETPLPELERRVASLTSIVNVHLRAMGAVWD